ncbi:FkbM family methyltransferase [Alphaproteobacteria bacterium]|nr:FkbM family methyltransferase [Alphaproteobacteria bacterium]
MNILDFTKKLNEIKELKSKKDYKNSSLNELLKLPMLNGVFELFFNNYPFYMLNTSNDDAVVLKYLWRNYYENISLSLWYKITRKEGIFFDVGAHTGIYTIIGNLNNEKNKIVSIEPYYLNYSRLLSNLKINKITTNNCFLTAASNEKGIAKLNIKSPKGYHSAGGKISENGNFSVSKVKIDDFELKTTVQGIKIDTEGHEYQVIEGAKNIIVKNSPDIIFEINEQSFDKCINFLKLYQYNFYFIDEINKNIAKVDKFHDSLKRPEGSNCIATTDEKYTK